MKGKGGLCEGGRREGAPPRAENAEDKMTDVNKPYKIVPDGEAIKKEMG